MVGLPGVLLIIGLVIIGGVVAYVGDIVGRRIGRKRLSLLGMRPRHTAVAVSVVAGMLITLLTLAAAMAISRDVKDGFLRVQQMRRKQAELSGRLRALNEQMARLDRDRSNAERKLSQRKAELDQTKRMLEKESDELRQTRSALGDASSALKRAEEAFERVALSATNLARKKTELQRDIESLRAQAVEGFALERATPILFGAGQLLDWELIASGRPVEEIRRQLDRFVGRLDAGARAAGAQPLSGEESAIVIRKPARDPAKGSVVWFGQDQVLDAVAERVRESTGGVIVRAFSVFNTHPGEPVRVDFELFHNRLVFRRGEQLAETTVDGTLPEPTLMGQLVALLRDQVGAKARAHNVMPRLPTQGAEMLVAPREAVGEMSYEELFAVIEQLRRIAGPARVTAAAAADTWTIGPLEVDLLVAPAASPPPD